MSTRTLGRSIGELEQRLDEGTEESRREARREIARMRRLHAAESSNLPRLDLADLTFGRFATVTHEPTGDRYKVSHGEHNDAQYSNASAWYLDAGRGEPVYLERLK